MPAFDRAGDLLDDGHQQTENGYGVLRDGSYQVSDPRGPSAPVRPDCS